MYSILLTLDEIAVWESFSRQMLPLHPYETPKKSFYYMY